MPTSGLHTLVFSFNWTHTTMSQLEIEMDDWNWDDYEVDEDEEENTTFDPNPSEWEDWESLLLVCYEDGVIETSPAQWERFEGVFRWNQTSEGWVIDLRDLKG